MKKLINTLILSVTCSIILPATAATNNIDSVYTKLSGPTCKPLESNAEEGWATGRCKGTAGYQLDWLEGDIRQSLNVIDPQGKEFPLELWTTVSGGFSSLGDTAEWRVKKIGKQSTPQALIVRFNVSEDPEKPEKITSYLVVSKITPTEVCVTDIVKPTKDTNTANQQARTLADAAANKTCKQTQANTTEATPRYLCQADEQLVFGCNAGNKMISLCASPNVTPTSGYMQYRFGTPTKVELTYPEARKPPKGYFWHSFTGYSGGFDERIRFKNQGVQYVLFDRMIRTGFDENGNKPEMTGGVGIRIPGKPNVTRLCSSYHDGDNPDDGFLLDENKSLGDLLDNEEFDYEYTPNSPATH